MRGGVAGTHLDHSTADLGEQSGIPADTQRLHERIVIVGAHHHHVVTGIPVGDQKLVYATAVTTAATFQRNIYAQETVQQYARNQEKPSHPTQLLPHFFSSQAKFVKHVIGNSAGIDGVLRQQPIFPNLCTDARTRHHAAIPT